MALQDIFSSAKEVIAAIKDLAIHDTDFQNDLTQAGGLVSLIGIGFQYYEKYREKLKSPEEKAFASLLKYIFQTTDELLKDVKYSEQKKIALEGKEIKKGKENFERNWNIMNQELLQPFEESYNWNSYLPEHPAIKQVVRRVATYLKDQGHTSDKINNFIIKFNIVLENDASKDESIQNFYQWWTIQRDYRKLVEYLEYIKAKTNYLKDLDDKPLYQYYVENDAALVEVDNTWSLKDTEIRKKHGTNIQNAIKTIDDFLNSNDWYQVVGASFGIGKSSMLKMIAANYASLYLRRDDNFSNSEKVYYIPILVFLKNGFKNVYYQHSLDHVLNKIISPNEQSYEKPILLMLDGLDEYNDDTGKPLNDTIRDLRNVKLEELFAKYSNIKILITTRLHPEIPSILGISDKKYVRLLPFTDDQLKIFYQKYNEDKYEDALKQNYDYRPKLELATEERTKPLFAWMLARMQSAKSDIKIKFKEEWSESMKKSIIYMLFFHYILKGRYKTSFTNLEWNELYDKEKKILRKIAALKQIYAGNLTLELLKEKIEMFNPLVDLSKVDQVVESYFNIQPMSNSIDFLHESFKEYLLSEYYVEALLENRVHRLNIGIPSSQTIEFLDGLIELLNSKEEVDERHISPHVNSLLNSLNSSYLDQRSAIMHLIDVVSNSVDQEQTIFLHSHFTDTTESTWKEIILTDSKYEQLWIHRWISLYILKKLSPAKVSNEKLVNLLRYSDSIPRYLLDLKNTNLSGAVLIFVNLSSADLSRIDLSKANLSYANLAGADCNHANLAGATLIHANLMSIFSIIGTNLSYADLSKANLSYANLAGADCNHANFAGANLTRTDLASPGNNLAKFAGANLTRTDLASPGNNLVSIGVSIGVNILLTLFKGVESNFSYADLSKANLSYANLAGADCNHANFTEANLSYADLSNANLSHSQLVRSSLQHSNLSKANLSYANLSNADLSYSILTGCKKYSNLECNQTNFHNAIIDNKELVDYLNDHNAYAKNVQI